jgi:hypothetical protein
MKLPLIHHGYQGKHKRGQVPRQRDDESSLHGKVPRQRDDDPAQRAVKEQDPQGEQGRARFGYADSHDGDACAMPEGGVAGTNPTGDSPVSRAGMSGGSATAPSAGVMPDADVISDADVMPDTGTWPTDLPEQRPPSATGKPAGSSGSRM